MIIRHVHISNFRGIAELNWPILERFVVLVGPGDAGKTTVFEAIDLTLGRQWYTPTDADFLDGDYSKTITIEVTVGDLPDGFLDLHAYGTCLRGWSNGKLHDEPVAGDEHVVTVRLTIDSSLEPEWTLAADRFPEGVHVRAADRMKLGFHRLGANVDHQLGWGRGSLLTKLSDSSTAVQGVLGHAARQIREATVGTKITGIEEAVVKATSVADRVGVAVAKLNPAISAADLALGGSLLVLHDGKVPVRQLGLGSRRLLAIGLGLDAIRDGGIGILDEVEHGLEPYRIHNLVTAIRSTADAKRGQVLLTTHSADVIKDCGAEHLHVVRRGIDGTVTITPMSKPDADKTTSDGMQRMVRTCPEALLSRKVVVCEGKTEYGLIRGLDAAWNDAGKPSLSSCGCVPINGGGNCKAAQFSVLLKGLGYEVCFFGDSDQDPNPSWASLTVGGVVVIRWKDPWAIEDAIFLALPWADVLTVISAIAEDKDTTYLKNLASNKKLGEVHDWLSPVSSWADTPELRMALAAMGKKTKPEGQDAGKNKSSGGESDAAFWIKDMPIGDLIGRRIAAAIPSMQSDHEIAAKIASLRSWIDPPRVVPPPKPPAGP